MNVSFFEINPDRKAGVFVWFVFCFSDKASHVTDKTNLEGLDFFCLLR